MSHHERACEATLNALPDAVLRLAQDGHIAYLNAAARQLLGLPADNGLATGEADANWQLIDRRTRTPILPELLVRARIGGPARLPAGSRLVNGRGLEIEVDGACQTLGEAGDTAVGYVLQLRDITEEQEWRRQQPDLWDRDPVTALPGRRFMENRLDQVLINKRAADLPMSFIAIRCHGVPKVYQALGETAGDTLVRDLSALLRAHVRDTDLIARMDTHSFGLVLTFCPAEISRRIAGDVQASLAGFRFVWRGHAYPVEAVLGQVDVPPFAGCLDELLAAAGIEP
jgi:diguanylate cyclase (GGDEF)-like protein